jgi:hypothetical protein
MCTDGPSFKRGYPPSERFVNGASSLPSGGRRHDHFQGSAGDPVAKEADMKKFLALTGIAASLLVAVPAFAHDGRDGGRDGGRHGPAYHQNDRDHGRDHGRWSHRHESRRDFSYWRPRLERAHYRGFGRPVLYKDHYRVQARDVRGRLVILHVDAFTGSIIRVGF